MKKSKKKLSLKKISISKLDRLKGGEGTVWCTITIGTSGAVTCYYTGTCPPTEESLCCDTRADTHCDVDS